MNQYGALVSVRPRMRELTVHGTQDVAHFRSSACTDLKVGTCAWVYVDTIVAMVSHREAYEAGRPDFIECAAVGAVLGSAIDCLADGPIFIPIREVFSEMKLFPA